MTARRLLPLRAGVLPLAVALAGCSASPDQGAARQQQEQVRAGEVQQLRGWERAFQPDVAVAAANQFGFHAPAYAAADGGFVSQGRPVMITGASAGKPNTIGFEAKGQTPERVDTLAFRLALADAAHAETARTRFADVVRDFLFQSKIDAKPIHAKLAKGEAGTGQLDGIDYAIEKAADGLAVTFHRTGASAPANRHTA